MKKNVALFLVLFCMYPFVYAQSLAPTVLSSQSGEIEYHQMVLNWTLGETIIETVTMDKYLISQGFHQPFLERDVSVTDLQNHLEIYPNPVDSYLTVVLTSDTKFPLLLSVYDMNGREVLKTIGFVADRKFQLNVKDLPSGMYMLYVSNEELFKTFKIIKF